jgi:hypothetical protein
MHIHSMAYLWQRNNRMEMGSGRTSSTESCSFSNATAQRKTGCTPQDLLYAVYSLPFDIQIRIEQKHSKRNLHELYIILGAKGRRRGRGELPKQYRQLFTVQCRVHFQEQFMWNTR